MPRHLTLRDIGRGYGRRRRRGVTLLVRRRPWVALPAVLLVMAAAVLMSGQGRVVFGLGDMRRCASTTALVVASSVDKAPLLSKLGADFSHRGPDVTGRCIAVRVVAKSSGAAETALADGWLAGDGPRPDVWSPSGSVWLPLLEDRLAAGQRSSLIPAPASVPSIAASPMVVAMPRPMAQALGWPDKPIGWSDLLELASSGTGWARFGHPEWGQFRLGKTNPNFSHAGLEGTIAGYYAAVGRTSGLTLDDVASAQTRKFVAGVEQSIVRYGDNTVTFLSDWQRADATGQALSYISAVVTEENLVPSYNDGNPGADPAQVGKNPHPTVPLVAIYPREGTFIADHPYAVLSEPWVNADKRAAAAAFLDYLLSPKVQKVWQDNHYRDAQDRLGLGDGLADGVIPSQPVKVLQPPAAAVTNAVLTSWAQLRKTANVLNVMDVSGSMADRVAGTGKTKLEAAQQAAIASLSLFTDHDEVGLWTFSGGVAGKQDYTQLVPIGPMDEAVGPTVRRTALAQALQAATPGGNTGLYNTIFAAYRTVLARYQDDRINAVVILTDGKNDAVGGLDLKGLLDGIATASGGRAVRIFTIAYGPDADQSVLAQIAHATGGATYVAATPADISKVYSAALSNL